MFDGFWSGIFGRIVLLTPVRGAPARGKAVLRRRNPRRVQISSQSDHRPH